MNLLLILPGFIVAFASILLYKLDRRKLCKELSLYRKLSKSSKNNVHFYVARDKYNGRLYLYLGEPIKGIVRFHACHNGCIVACDNSCTNLSDFGLNPKDFGNLKFEDEPVEVFLDLK